MTDQPDPLPRFALICESPYDEPETIGYFVSRDWVEAACVQMNKGAPDDMHFCIKELP